MLLGVTLPLGIGLLVLFLALCIGCGEKDKVPTGPIGEGCPPEAPSKVDIPAAGLQGIVLTPGEQLVFEIDRLRTTNRLLWDNFVRRFPDANIEMAIIISPLGDVVRYTDHDFGRNPAAFDLIWSAVRTWKFKDPCRSGRLRLVFNASASRITIYKGSLDPTPGYEQCPCSTGVLYRIENRDPRYRVTPVYGD